MGTDPILFNNATFSIHASSMIIFIGLVCCYLMTLIREKKSGGTLLGASSLFFAGFIMSVFFSRLAHWYFNPESYDSIRTAFTNPDIGNFVLPVAVACIWFSDWLIGKLGLSDNGAATLDSAAPGVCLLIIAIRISSFFTGICRGKILMQKLKFLPFSVAVTDAAGNKTFWFATFAVSALLLILVFIVLIVLTRRAEDGEMDYGDVWYWFILLYSVISIIMDSTRSDSPLMHFRILNNMNKYSAFVSLGQVIPAIFTLIILVKFSIRAIKNNGFKWYLVVSWILFPVSLFGVGKLGEYNVQRYATYGKCYTIMAISLLVLLISEYIVYRAGNTERAENGHLY